MIISQTPVRISFLGGGTDFAAFYEREPGMVVSSAVDKYIYVIVKERFDSQICVGYSRMETVDEIDDLEHELVREALRLTNVRRGIEIQTIADIPSAGSGLGSSSAVTVGVLNALYLHQAVYCDPERIAGLACRIEIDILGKPIGKQDQYASACGGLNAITFHQDGSVEVDRLPLSTDEMREFEEHLLLFYTGRTRKAEGILKEQNSNTDRNFEALVQLRDLARVARDDILDLEFESVGHAMHRGWELKKSLASGVADGELDEIYDAALEAGALGGKVTGAGGGGFFLFFCPPSKHRRVRRALSGLRELPIRLECDGTKALLNVRRR